MQRVSATSCNWRWMVCPIRSPSTPWARTPWDWIWGPPRSPSSHARGRPRLEVLCAELAPDAQAIRRLQRQMERQRRANNPDNYDERGTDQEARKARLSWKHSKRYLATRRRKATRERKLAAHRKSLHGRLVHEIVAVGTTIITEKLSYRAWQKQFGKSVGLRAPGMFIELLRRTVASTGGTLVEVPTRTTKLSQFCHGCGALSRNRCGSAGTSAPVASGRSSATSIPRFWPPIWIQQISSLVCPVPGVLGRSGARPAGSIRVSIPTRECGADAAPQLRYPRRRSASARKSERTPHKSHALLHRQGTWKRSQNARNLQGFSPERSQISRASCWAFAWG